LQTRGVAAQRPDPQLAPFKVLTEYLTHYNGHRPHRALDQWAPKTSGPAPVPGREPDPSRLRRNEVLGGLIKEYPA
jgi:hypothetical protein